MTSEPSSCPHCGQPLSPGANFCSSCGHTVEDKSAPPPPPTSCPRCDSPVIPPYHFCQTCGYSFTADGHAAEGWQPEPVGQPPVVPVAATGEEPRRRRGAGGWWALLVIVVVLAGVSGLGAKKLLPGPLQGWFQAAVDRVDSPRRSVLGGQEPSNAAAVPTVTVAPLATFTSQPRPSVTASAITVTAHTPTATRVAPSMTPTPAATKPPTATPSLTPVPPTATAEALAKGDLILADAFTRNVASWPEGPSTASGVRWFLKDGAFHIALDAASSINWGVPGQNCACQDFILEVDARLLEGSDDAGYGVLFRYTNPESYYYFELTGRGSFRVLKRQSGKTLTLVEETRNASIMAAGQVNSVMITAQGYSFSFYVNRARVGTAADRSFATGKIGLALQTAATGGAHASFDNLLVWGLRTP